MYLSVCLFYCLSVYLPVCLPVLLSIFVFVSLSACFTVYLCISLSVCLFYYIYIYLFLWAFDMKCMQTYQYANISGVVQVCQVWHKQLRGGTGNSNIQVSYLPKTTCAFKCLPFITCVVLFAIIISLKCPIN